MKKLALAATVSLATLAAAAPAVAQDQPADDTISNEIIVTGEKRSESLQDISAAATVLSGDSLAEKGVERLDDLQNVVPSLSITDAGLTQSVNIRGVGLASGSPNAANGVATYFDGVFQPPIVSTNSFYDIQSVEVFRGPQGTFVGSNSTGGAIFINSTDPRIGQIGGYFQGEIGNYDRGGLQGAINLPLGDVLAIRAAGIYRHRDTFYKMTTSVPAPGFLEEKGGRIGLAFEPSVNFRAVLKGEVARKSTGGYAYRPTLGTRYEAFRTSDIYLLNYDDATSAGYDGPTRNDEKADQYTARLEYETDGGVIFRSISGYQNKRISNFYDTDATNAAALPKSTQDQFVRERVWTQELNVISPDAARLRWIVGGYYQKNKILVDISNTPNTPVHVDIDIQNRKITTGVFGQVSYDLNDKFSVDLGLRYSTYKVDGTGAVQLVTPGGKIFLADPGGQEKDDKLTGKFAVNFTPNDDNLFYAFVARGYKSGGIQSPTTTFAPETVTDYEVGWKGTLAGGAVTTQVGAFWYDYKNFQLDALDAVTGRAALINLTDATIKGVEAQVQARVGGFRLGGNVAYTDSSLAGTQFVDSRGVAYVYPGVSNAPQCAAGQPSNPPLCLNYAPFIGNTSGGPALYSPKWTYSLSAEYAIDAGPVTITPQATFSHVGSRYTYIAYDPVRDRLPAYDLLNATIAFDFDRFGFELWGTNLGKERYVTGQSGSNEFYGAPREYGIRATVDF